MSNHKRISVYFNLDVQSDKELWDHLNSSRKSELIKRLLREDMLGIDKIKPKTKNENKNNGLTKNDLAGIVNS